MLSCKYALLSQATCRRAEGEQLAALMQRCDCRVPKESKLLSSPLGRRVCASEAPNWEVINLRYVFQTLLLYFAGWLLQTEECLTNFSLSVHSGCLFCVDIGPISDYFVWNVCIGIQLVRLSQGKARHFWGKFFLTPRAFYRDLYPGVCILSAKTDCKPQVWMLFVTVFTRPTICHAQKIHFFGEKKRATKLSLLSLWLQVYYQLIQSHHKIQRQQ